jgi:alpha-beta hydrolase superfamily lysophospholipase
LAELHIEQKTFSDGQPGCHVRRWLAVGRRRGGVVVLHGIQSHGGWYEQSCSRLADAGYDVWLPDRRGSGQSDGPRGDAPSFRRLLGDVDMMVSSVSEPRFLAGISWGGKLALAFAARHPGRLAGVTLIAPGLCERVGYKPRERLRIAVARLIKPSRRFPLPLNDPELFTSNPERQRFIRADPLALREATARLLIESRRLDVYLRFRARRLPVPTLLVLAERDRIIDNARTRRLVARLRPSELTIREYAAAHHTLEFEPDGPPFVDDWIAWLDRHGEGRPATLS